MPAASSTARKCPAGAELTRQGVHFRLWAPRCHQVELAFVEPDGRGVRQVLSLEAEDEGYHSLLVPEARAGDLYAYRINGHERTFPDPASRFQPFGVHGPSQVVDPRAFPWSDADWPGVKLPGQVVYEFHVGTFTPEGTWAAAAEKLPHLRDVGVTLLEVMPIADFHGDYGWGYDGVVWYAPTRLYGTPDDARRFIDEAHLHGIGVILDVVYNHFGANGNYAGLYSKGYVSKRHPTEWGDAINYDGEQSQPVRDFVTANAAYWIDEFHLDGLRIDATQAIYDDSPRHLLADLSVAARKAAGKRSILLFAENESQQICHVEPIEKGGFGLDALWNDDFHHSCRVAASGHAEFYYADYAGSPQEILSAIRHGYLYQGQFNPRQKKRRGSPTRHCKAPQFVHFLQNHDQVANSGRALRLNSLTSAGRYRALTAALLLTPPTPLLFMGQEFASTTPFNYFADHDVDLAKVVREGRWGYIRNFPRTAKWGDKGELADPSSHETFESCKLDWDQCRRNQDMLLLHKDLLRLRREDPIFSQQDWKMLDGAVVGPEAFILRWFSPDENDRLLCVNLGRDMDWRPVPEPLAAPPRGQDWHLLWASEQFEYAGSGAAEFSARDWIIPGHTAIVLEAVPLPPEECSPCCST